jgi:CPA2 family monovalent cation:H+ antiporter-2
MRLFDEVLILLLAAVVAVIVLRRLHIPPVIGYLLVGTVVGPQGLKLIPQVEDVSALGWFGVAFLLFTVGLEFSFSKVKAMKGTLLILGAAQVFLTAAVIAVIAWGAGVPPVDALAIGAILAQSSSTIIGRHLIEQQELGTRHGRLSIGISVFQDVTAMPFVILIPALAGGSGGGDAIAVPVLIVVGKALAAVVLMIAVGRWVLRPLLHQIAATRSQELLTLAALLVALAAAWVTDAMGLSLALGAFLGGMMLGETEFRHQIEAEIRPFRDVLLGMFLVTMGMLLDARALAPVWPWVVAMTVGGMAVKAGLVAGLVRLAGEHGAVALRTGLVLAVGGEFGFALLALAQAGNLLNSELLQIVLSSVLLAMLLGPVLIRFNGILARRLFRVDRKRPIETTEAETSGVDRHVILCGYGRVGRSMAHVLERSGIACVGVDFDPSQVREAGEAGERVLYGDSSRTENLRAAGIERAGLLVVTFDDPPAALKILTQARALKPRLPVLVRTRDEAHLELLEQAGATEVVPDTLESSLMLAAHAMLLLGEPVSRVARRVDEVRRERYRLLRDLAQEDAESEYLEYWRDEPR